MLSSEWSRQEATLELEALSFKLVACTYPSGAAFTLPGTMPNVTLIVSGSVLGGSFRARLSEGELLEPRQRYVSQTPLQLWQVTGDKATIAKLRHFAVQLRHKDRATAAHAARVGLLAREMGQGLKLPAERLDALSLGAYLHDLGKLNLPNQLLYSPKRLSLAQWQLMARHPHDGSQLLKGTPLAQLGPILEQHHERLDGSGYPYGLTGSAISLEAFIAAVADTFDAITHPRPYQSPRNVQQALSEINRYSDVLYPSKVVEALNQVAKLS